jgi:N-acetylneuraminic acid mutarotase
LPIATAAENPKVFEWSNFPDLPPASGEIKQAGLAGPFTGIHGDALLVAGGANFPDLPAWRGGQKKWWDDIYVLEQDAAGKPKDEWFTSPKLDLLQSAAYGVAISTDKGLLCIGGRDDKRCHRDVYRLQWL